MSKRLPTGEDVIDEPFPVLLTNDRFTDHSGILKHVVRGLKDALKVGGVALRQRELIAKPVERDPPSDGVADAGCLDQAVEASGDRRRQREIPHHVEPDDMPGRDVLANDRREDHARFARLSSDDGGKERQLVALAQAAALDRY